MSGKIVRFNRSLYGLKHAPQSSVGWRPDCNPTDRHWKAVLKIMAYLHGTRGMGLTFLRGLGLDLTAYSDADYARRASHASLSEVHLCRILLSNPEVAGRGYRRRRQQRQSRRRWYPRGEMLQV